MNSGIKRCTGQGLEDRAEGWRVEVAELPLEPRYTTLPVTLAPPNLIALEFSLVFY
jgi:nitrogen fixation protein